MQISKVKRTLGRAVVVLLLIPALALCSCGTKKTPVIAEGLPKFTVTGETKLTGNFFLSFVYSRNLIMLDGKGNIVWSKHEEQPSADLSTGWWDFKKHVIDGKTYYSYHDQTGTYDDYGMRGYAPGERVILDDSFQEIKRITFEESDVTEKGDPLDGHDFLMIDLDHYILSGYRHDTVYNIPDYPEGSKVVYSYLQEVDHGEVVWDWKSIDYPELYSLSNTDSEETANDFANETTDAPDYVHFNAMRLTDEGNLLCSFRHLSTVMCLDRTKREDQIIWKLSGAGDEFGLLDEEKTSGQHFVTMDDNYISVFDNDNKGGITRMTSYLLDTGEKKTLGVKRFVFNQRFTDACGSFQHLPGDIYVIGWGHSTKDADCMTVIDADEGVKKMTVTLENPDNFTYRCVYYE